MSSGEGVFSHFKARYAMLKAPGFLGYILSALFATLGSGLSYIVTCWIVVKINPSVFSVAILSLSFWLPNIVLSPLAGVIVDRYPRRWVLLISNMCRMLTVCFYIFCWPAGIHSWFGLCLLSVIQGVFFTVVMPATTTFVREIVHKDQLLYANAMVDIAYEVGNMVGMGFAGLLIAAVTDVGALLISGLLFIFSSIGLCMIPKRAIRFGNDGKEESVKKSSGYFDDLRSGWRYLRNNKVLLLVYSVQLILFEQYMTLPILLLPFAEKVLHANVGQLGMISAAMSVGIIFAGLILPWLCDLFGLVRMSLIMFVMSGVAFLAFGVNHLISVSEILYFILGFTMATWPMLLTLAQEKTALPFQGRVQSLFASLASAVMVIIYLALSLADRYFDLQWLYFFETMLSIVGFQLMMRYSRRQSLVTQGR